VFSSHSDFHSEQKCILIVQTVLVVCGNGNMNGNTAVGKMGMEQSLIAGMGRDANWKSHRNGREWESKYYSRTPLVLGEGNTLMRKASVTK